MPEYVEEKVLRDIIVRTDGSMVAAYNFKITKDGEDSLKDVIYEDYDVASIKTDEIRQVLERAMQQPSN